MDIREPYSTLRQQWQHSWNNIGIITAFSDQVAAVIMSYDNVTECAILDWGLERGTNAAALRITLNTGESALFDINLDSVMSGFTAFDKQGEVAEYDLGFCGTYEDLEQILTTMERWIEA